ncbi:hypothetical protein HZS_3539 [Henneguya salminicola]|nr:hypothetical protein HZS_3539 [Henneguya salminicola]
MHDDVNEINEYLVNASKDLSKYLSVIRFLNGTYKAIAIKIPSRNQVYNRIGYLTGPSTEALLTIEIQPHNSTIAERPFLQRSWVGKIYGEFQFFFMWSSDEGLAILRMGSELFVDATFRVTPHSFAQCLIVINFDHSTNFFVPCVWALMSRSNEYLYCELLHAIISQKSVVFDFEKALLNSVKYQFPKSKIIGYYFHMRRAIFLRMKKYGIPDEAQIALNIKYNAIDDDQIDEKFQEIENLKGLTPKNWPQILEYFSRIWLEKYPPSLWKNERQTENINLRTNNCLERYNRRLGSKFQNTHPNIFGFFCLDKR